MYRVTSHLPFGRRCIVLAALALAACATPKPYESVLRSWNGATEAEFVARYGDHLGHSTWAEFAEKRLTAERADALNHQIAVNWQKFVAHAHKIALPSTQVAAALRAAGAPTTPEAIHLDRQLYEGALTHAREIRNRYTVLDLAASSGRLAGLVPRL